MKIVLWRLDRVKPYERNPRDNDAAVDAVAASIKEFGFRKPIVVDADGVIICGHTCFRAAKKLELAKVPVHVATDLTPVIVKRWEEFTGQKAKREPSARPPKKATAAESTTTTTKFRKRAKAA